MTPEQREEYAKALRALDEKDAAIEASRKPFDAQLVPFIQQAMAVEEEREVLIDKAGVDMVGRCECCGKVLLSGDQGSRPYNDDDGIIFCAEHGMTYGDLRQNWADMPVLDDDEEYAEMRKHATETVEGHLASGGALTDLLPTAEL